MISLIKTLIICMTVLLSIVIMFDGGIKKWKE